MKKQTSIAKSIDVVDRDAQYDQACKKLLANREILAWILKASAQEFSDCSIKEIAEYCIISTPEISAIPVHPGETNTGSKKALPPDVAGLNNEDNVYGEGTITYDIRFQARYPDGNRLIKIFVNVEAQKNFYPGYALQKRGIFYCCRMISSQYNTEFTEPYYDDIKKVYSIWICMNPSRQAANSITQYCICKKQLKGFLPDKKENYDLMTLVLLCLGGEESQQYQGIVKLLDVLLSEKKMAVEKKQILEQEFNIQMTQTMEKEVYRMGSFSEALTERVTERVTAEVTAEVTATVTATVTAAVTESVEKRFEKLNLQLLKSKRYDDLEKASQDKKYREVLFTELGI